MRVHRFSKLLLLMLLGPLILVAWAMICVGERKEISLQDRESNVTDDTGLRFYTRVGQETSEILAAEKSE
jgi:hypothetical protein